MNRVLHIAATTQIRLDTEGRAYYRRKLAAGKSRMEAMRCLKRRVYPTQDGPRNIPALRDLRQALKERGSPVVGRPHQHH